jgi:hypothetical protein
MTTCINRKNILMYIGNSYRFPTRGWIHPCYLCEAPQGNYEMFCGVEVYVCKKCRYISFGRDGTVHKNHSIT